MVRRAEFFGLCAIAIAVAAFAAGCGGSPAPPPQVPAGTITVNGTERLAWDQSSPDGTVAQYSYAAYVDGVRQSLPASSCQSSQDGTQAQCESPLPRMSVGLHTLELASVFSTVESARSAPLRVNVVSSTTGTAAITMGSSAAPGVLPLQSPATTSDSGPPRSARDGTRFVVETLATGLDTPSAIATLPDGRVLVAERSGRVWVWQQGAVRRAPALQLDDAVIAGDAGLVDLTPHPDFATNRQLYLAYTARTESGAIVNRVVRFRELNGVLAESAAILEDPVAQPPQRTPRIRFGPDRKLYVGFPAGVDPSVTGGVGSYAGNILRLNDDGTTPAENPGYSPIISYGDRLQGHRSPAAFDWQPQSGRFWLSEQDWNDRDVLRAGMPPDPIAYTFASRVDSAAAAFYRGTPVAAFNGDFFISALDGRRIERVRFDRSNPGRVVETEPLLDGEFGRIADIVVGPDGAIYFCTSNTTAADQPAADLLLRIVPLTIPRMRR